jgi:hypothetical protein
MLTPLRDVPCIWSKHQRPPEGDARCLVGQALSHGLRGAIDVDRMTRFSLLCRLRHMDGKDTILVLCRALALIDVVDVERTAHAALAAFAADVVALLVLFIFRIFMFRGDSQIIVVVRQGDVFLLEARQLSREVVAVLVVFDINLEFRSMEALHKRFIKDIHEAIKYVFFSLKIIVGNKWNQTKHNQKPLSTSCRCLLMSIRRRFKTI